MNDYEKNKLMVSAARLYYEAGLSQDDIARKMHISRPYVSKLLKMAREKGIVKIQVVDPMDTESGLEKKIRRLYGLERVIIVRPHDGEDMLKSAAEAAGRFLDSILKEGDIIGTSWGRTMYEMSKQLIARGDLKGLTYVQLCGGVSNVSSTVYASEIARNFSKRLGCASYLLPVSAVVGSRKLKQMLEKDVDTAKVLECGKNARIAVFTIGAFGQGDQSALVRAGYLDKDDTKRLMEAGAAGDICTHVIDKEGNICDPELESRTMAVSLEEIKKKEYRIGVALGREKEGSIPGALKSGIMNVFITDECTAMSIAQIK